MSKSLWSSLLKSKTQVRETEQAFVNYYEWLKNLALSLFVWENLPDTVNERYLEMTLFDKGQVLFFQDPTRGFLALSCLRAGLVNVYGEPTEFKAFGHDYEKTLNATESVLIRNNDMEVPTAENVRAYAKQLTTIERTTDINLYAQRTPLLLLADESQALTMKNIQNQYDEYSPFLFLKKSLYGSDVIQAIKTDAPYIVDKLDLHKMNVWNDALTFLGVNNANTEKKERLIVDEVTANEHHLKMNLEVMLKTRQEACDKINEMYGLDISVRERYQQNEERGEGFVDLYDRVEVSNRTGE